MSAVWSSTSDVISPVLFYPSCVTFFLFTTCVSLKKKKKSILNCFLNIPQEFFILPNNSIYKKTQSSSPSLWAGILPYFDTHDRSKRQWKHIPYYSNLAVPRIELWYPCLLNIKTYSNASFYLKTFLKGYHSQETSQRGGAWKLLWGLLDFAPESLGFFAEVLEFTTDQHTNDFSIQPSSVRRTMEALA